MPDRRLIGLLAIVFIITTVITGITFNIKEPEYIQFLARFTPEIMQCGPRDTTYHSFDFMVTKDLPDIVIRCGFLYKPPVPCMGSPWGKRGAEQKRIIEGFLETLQKDQSTTIYQTYEIEGKGGTLHIIDFTEAMATLVGEDMIKNYDTIYALEEDENGNLSFYRGVRDFFFNSDATITEIKYSRRGMTTIYRSEDAQAEGEEYPPISEAPIGKIRMQNLSSSEKIHFEISMGMQYMPCHNGVIRIVRVDTGYGQGEPILDRIGFTPVGVDTG